MNNEQTLLAKDSALRASARQSTKDEQARRRKQQLATVHQWWEDELSTLEEHVRECLPDSYPDSDSDTALENVRRNLRRCKASTRAGFIAWAVKQLAKEKGFHLVAGAIQRFDLDISDWIDDAALRLSRYVNFPEHVKESTANGELYRVLIGQSERVPIIWTVPERYWEFAKKLWPVTLKRRANGAYFIAKQIAGQTIPVHRLVLNCGPGDTVQSTSGNFLDWTSLYVKPLNQSGLYDGRNTSWNKEAARPNTAQEEFEHRFQSPKALANYAVNHDGTQRWALHQPISANADLAATTTCWGKVGSTGWSPTITSGERNYYAPELPSIPVERSARRLEAEQKLDQLGL